MSNAVMVNSAGMTIYITGNPHGDYSVVTRDDGSQQLAYKGKPLYLYIKDQKPGDVPGITSRTCGT